MPYPVDTVIELPSGATISYGPRRHDGDVVVACPPNEATLWGVYVTPPQEFASHWRADCWKQEDAKAVAHAIAARMEV